MADRKRSEHRTPGDCPVCGDGLTVTRLGCSSCGTQLVGEFEACHFCSLTARETDLLRVFLISRGNMREVEKHLGVSYPTARLRFRELLQRLGLGEAPEAAPLDRDQILSEVAAGALTPAEGAELLIELSP